VLQMPAEQAVADANERFYAALSGRDLDAMDAIWLAADWVECVHPGWTPLRGWDAVRESWTAIFHSTARLLVQAADVHIRLAGDVAWVTCLERVSMRDDTHLDTRFAHATNIFIRRGGAWHLVLHHASPVTTETPTLWGPSGVN
jgi:ketosteroid isomerase-like protein